MNLFAFVMKSMLPPAIKGQVVETELNINTSSEFHNEKIQTELQEIEEYKEMHKKLGSKSDSKSSNKDQSEIRSDYHDRTSTSSN